MAEAVLDFGLEMPGEAVSQGQIDPDHVAVPGLAAARPIRHGAENLLVPRCRGIQLRGDLVFGLHVIGEGIGIADVGHLKSIEKDFTPQLPAVPGVADIIA